MLYIIRQPEMNWCETRIVKNSRLPSAAITQYVWSHVLKINAFEYKKMAASNLQNAIKEIS